MRFSLSQKLAAEFLGTAGLVAAVVGSGIMAERLTGGDEAITLLANTAATGTALAVLIITFFPISGAHINPAVTITEAFRKNISYREAAAFVAAQISGGLAGTGVANRMFELPVFTAASKVRAGSSLFLAEIVATFGLILVIQAAAKFDTSKIAFAVAAYISAAYWFTSSTSFANPAVTIARAATDTFTGIAPSNVPLFIIAQMIGGFAATLFGFWLLKNRVDDDG